MLNEPEYKPESHKNPATRIPSIDLLRGLVILIMMVDHVRERFFMHTPVGDPIYDSVSTEFFFTRFVTHLCAPIFIFLAGMSAYLYATPPMVFFGRRRHFCLNEV